MQSHTKLTTPAPFRAKLRHYHRTAAPDLYERKQKRWEDCSSSDLANIGNDKNDGVDLSLKLPEKPSSSEE